MLPGIRILLLVAAISGVMALLSPAAHAITITRAEVQWSDAVVMGRGAGPTEAIYWYWGDDEGDVENFTANKRGKFSFKGTVPSDCEGILRAGEEGEEVPVPLSNCMPTPPDSEEPISDLVLVAKIEGEDAHNGEGVRAVGFVVDISEKSWVVSGGDDATLRTWSLPVLQYLEEPEDLLLKSSKPLDHPIYDFETSDDGSVVATGEGDWNGGPGSETLRIWPAENLLDPNEDPFFIGTTAPIGFVYCVAISPYDLNPAIDSLWTVASGFYGEIVVYYTSSLDEGPLAIKKTKMKRTKALAFSPDGTILASTSTAGRIQLWSFPKEDCVPESSLPCELGRLPVSLSHGGSWVFPIAFNPDPPSDGLIEIVSGSDSGMIKLWKINIEAPSDEPAVAIDSGAVYSLAYSPTEPSMIVAGGNGDITVYNAADLEIRFQAVNAHVGRVNDVAFSPDGSFIVSGGADGALKLWALDLGAP